MYPEKGQKESYKVKKCQKKVFKMDPRVVFFGLILSRALLIQFQAYFDSILVPCLSLSSCKNKSTKWPVLFAFLGPKLGASLLRVIRSSDKLKKGQVDCIAAFHWLSCFTR